MSDIKWNMPEIVTIGDPRLWQKIKKVDDVESVLPLCDKMVEKLRELNGAGLAAPQIGEAFCIIVIEVRKTELFPNRSVSPLYVMINPELLEVSEEKEVDWEACFSVPGMFGKVPRARLIKIRYTDLEGATKEEVFEGYLARVIQHEYDHLEGIEYLNRIKDKNSIYTADNWKEFIFNKL